MPARARAHTRTQIQIRARAVSHTCPHAQTRARAHTHTQLSRQPLPPLSTLKPPVLFLLRIFVYGLCGRFCCLLGTPPYPHTTTTHPHSSLTHEFLTHLLTCYCLCTHRAHECTHMLDPTCICTTCLLFDTHTHTHTHNIYLLGPVQAAAPQIGSQLWWYVHTRACARALTHTVRLFLNAWIRVTT